jgi:hypothetical protein
MLLKLFKGTGPEVIILIALIAAGLWLHALLVPALPESFHFDADPMPLYALMKNLAMKSAFWGTLFSLVLVFLMTSLLVSFNTSTFFINERTFLPSIIFVLLTSVFPAVQVFNPVLPASLLLMLAIRRIMDAYRLNGTAFNFFDASLLIGAGSLIYANLIWFGLLSFIGIGLLRTVNIKEIALALIGLITPPAITAGIYYVAGGDLLALARTAAFNLTGKAEAFHFSRLTVSGLVVFGLFTLVSLAYLLSVINSKKIRSRKTFSLLIWAMIISLVVYFAIPSASVEMIFLTAIPVSYIMTHYFVFVKKRLLPEIFFTVLILIAAAIQVFSAI